MIETNTLATVHQRLRDEHGVAASESSLRRYVGQAFPDRRSRPVTVLRPGAPARGTPARASAGRVDLSGVLQVAKDVRAADLVTADAGEGPVVLDAVAVVHRHPGETGQHPELGEAAQFPATQEEQCAQLGRGRQ